MYDARGGFLHSSDLTELALAVKDAEEGASVDGLYDGGSGFDEQYDSGRDSDGSFDRS